ncbi:hypothetical protein Q5424_09345 [Conexibacter sp. JD483]|uniref:hypothetical protein n=1 Tax=unclassified Conexibacter TaxID=2627773 RepID=UPI002720FD4B|nr:MULTISPECIES: hypothetical protein [unclassified Conexibacter]MDO8187219.1 hypothetical protein [Conexibacter sp. CPCC 205706]MDO8199316.1 hypothetical protein [Conexibacter sp. CPCC 205762]MDR9369283.1 hypothetical protein [Conexibacter sp. JD483]
MAKLRLQAELIFADDDPAAGETYDALVALAPRLGTIDEGRGTTPSQIALHRCHHDEPGGPACEPLQSWEAE